MRSLLAFVAVTSACGYPGLAALDASQVTDGQPDASTCFGSFVRICFSLVPETPQTFMEDFEVDTDATDATAKCDQHNNQAASYCVIAGTGFSIAATKTLSTHGSKPLVLLSTTTFSLSGIIDVSSGHTPGVPPAAGANSSMCPAGLDATGSSGGYGGSFGDRGGDGQSVDGQQGAPPAALRSFPATLRGGCPGGAGAGPGGAGGSSAGAVAIIATTIHLDGNIYASGSGGLGGPTSKSGGGGGGSGGMIVLDAFSIDGNGILVANGGGGGQGGTPPGTKGGSGSVGGESMDLLVAAAGGADPGKGGGGGGAGSVGPTLTGANASATPPIGGGGAGGGAAGFIRAHGATTVPTSPPPL